MTPASLITGVITEHGVIAREEGGSIDVRGYLRRKGLLAEDAPAAANGAHGCCF